jgi:hypothetical protein
MNLPPLGRRHALAAAGLLAPGRHARAAGKPGGTFIMVAEGEPIMLAALPSSDTPTKLVAGNLFNGFVTLGTNLAPVPELARSRTIV